MQMRASTLVMMLGATAALAACTPSAPPSATATATVSSTPASATASQSQPAPASATQTVTQTAQPTEGSTAASTGEQTTAVDAGAFKLSDGGYHFISPSGKIVCGGGGTGNAQFYVVGCQTKQPVAGIDNCAGDGAHQPLVAIRTKGEKEKVCATQGIFWGFDSIRTLNYGESLTVPGSFTCVSRESGISCQSLAVPGRFMIAREGITVE